MIRAAMYVEPMGRDVIFYIYPSDFVAGNNTDMNATIVTEASEAVLGPKAPVLHRIPVLPVRTRIIPLQGTAPLLQAPAVQ